MMNGSKKPQGRSSGNERGGLGLRRLPDGTYELVHPACVDERREDYEEGIEIWRAGEPEEAAEALRYALDGCGDNLWVHVALGRIALEAGRDPELARGHFGYVLELVQRVLPASFAGPLPADRPANRPAYDAITGLSACLEGLGPSAEATELRRMADRWRGLRH